MRCRRHIRLRRARGRRYLLMWVNTIGVRRSHFARTGRRDGRRRFGRTVRGRHRMRLRRCGRGLVGRGVRRRHRFRGSVRRPRRMPVRCFLRMRWHRMWLRSRVFRHRCMRLLHPVRSGQWMRLGCESRCRGFVRRRVRWLRFRCTIRQPGCVRCCSPRLRLPWRCGLGFGCAVQPWFVRCRWP